VIDSATRRIAYLDCINGAAGDMILAALIDAGCPVEAVDEAVRACGTEARVSVSEVSRGGLRGLRLELVAPGREPERDLAACLAAVSSAALPRRVRDRASAVLQRLGETEARLHGRSPSSVQLHELGAVDTLVDIVGTCAALEALHVDEVLCSPVPVAPGTLAGEHGSLPLPAPATLAMLADARAPVVPGEPGLEQTTPTAAALLATLARFEVVAMRLERVGHGAGWRDDPRRPNIVRCWLGENASPPFGVHAGFSDPCVELRTNLDDVSPAVVSDLADRCLRAGALDAWVVPATMKKGRPGFVLHALAPPGREAAIAALILEHSPTMGVRSTPAPRMVAGRDVTTVDSPLGRVRVKRKFLDGHVVDARPELEDCRRLAEATGRPLHEVLETAAAAARSALFGGGEESAP